MNRRFVPAAIAAAAAFGFGLLLCISCGEEARQSAASVGNAGNDASAPDAQADGGAAARGGECGNVPVPKQHRAVAQVCPSERGSSGPIDMCPFRDREGSGSASADASAPPNAVRVLTDEAWRFG